MEEDDERQQWSDLPELILHAIAARLPGPADLLTFGGVCRSWRSISHFRSIEFFSSLPRPLFSSSLSPYSKVGQPFSGALILYSSQDCDVIYKYHSSAGAFSMFCFGASNLLLIGLSNGHFLTFNMAIKSYSVLNPFTTAQTNFPKLSFTLELAYALLTEADIAHPDCRLVLVDQKNSKIFYCLASRKQWQTLNFFPKNLTDVICYKGRLYLVRCHEQIFEYNFKANLLHELDVRLPFEGRLVESPYGDLVLLRTGKPLVVGWKVMPALKEDVSLEDHGWDRTFKWPAGNNLMFRWQRSDANGYPNFPAKCMRRKVAVINQHTTFWKNYLEHSLPYSNGLYVVVDDFGTPTLSDFVSF